MDEMKRRITMSAIAVKNMDIIKTVPRTFRRLVWCQKTQTYIWSTSKATTWIDEWWSLVNKVDETHMDGEEDDDDAETI